MPAERTWCAMSPASPVSTAPRNSRCSSRSELIGALQIGLCFVSLRHEHFERGQIGIPLDQGRQHAEAVERICVQPPYGVADRSAVRIDQYVPAAKAIRSVPGEVQL